MPPGDAKVPSIPVQTSLGTSFLAHARILNSTYFDNSLIFARPLSGLEEERLGPARPCLCGPAHITSPRDGARHTKGT